MSERKKTYQNIAISGIFTYINQGINFIAMVVLARLLSPADYGVFALIAVFSVFIAILQDNGIAQAIIRGNNEDMKYAEKLNTLSLTSGILSMIIMWVLAVPISIFYNNHFLTIPCIAISFTFLLNSLIIVPLALLQKELNFKAIGIIQLSSNIIALICCGIAAYCHLSYWSLIIRELAFLITQLIIVLQIKAIRHCLNWEELKNTFILIKKLSYSITGTGIINYFSRNTDNILIGKFYGDEKLGIYSRAYSLIYLSISLVSSAFNQVLFPSLTKKSTSNINQEYYFSINIISALLFPVMLLFITIPGHVTLILWGENWIEVSILLPYVGILIFSQCQLNINGNIFLLYKKEKYLIGITIANTTIAVISIIIGAFSSFIEVIKYYTLFYILLSIPITVFVVNRIVMQDSIYSIFRFWLPKVGAMAFAYFTINTNPTNTYWQLLVISIVFYLHIFIQEKEAFIKLLRKAKK